jgi:hypothetical protein
VARKTSNILTERGNRQARDRRKNKTTTGFHATDKMQKKETSSIKNGAIYLVKYLFTG